MPNWDTSLVTDMSGAPGDYTSKRTFNGDISKWNTEKVTTMKGMFQGAQAFNQDIGNWTTAQVTTMNGMFRDAYAFNGDISKWNTEKVTDMVLMFGSAYAFNQDIGGWNTAQVTDMESMFWYNRVFNQDIGSWNTAQVTSMIWMFRQTDAFNHDISMWTGPAAESAQTNMFYYATAFQAKFKCTNADTGPASSCAIPNYDQYYILAQNTCESEGYVTILNLNQCRIAGRALSGDASKWFRFDQPADGYSTPGSGNTGGCTFHSGNVNNDIQFFPYASGSCGLYNFHCICGAFD